jgi:hypothetical protein
MIAVVDFDNSWIRVDLKECARPGNIYHVARSNFGLRWDLEMAIDSVQFNYGLSTSQFRTSPAFQPTLDNALRKFTKQ